MPQIRPVSDLRNKFTEISSIVHEQREPVFLTRNGYGDMVVMSIEDYNDKKFLHDVDMKIMEAVEEAKGTKKRLTHEEVMANAEQIIKNAASKL